jgi:hypothetical protein
VIRFFLTLIVVAILMVASAWVMAQNQWWITSLPSFFYRTVIFLLFGTCVVFVYLYKFDKPDYFVHLYLLSMVVKLLAYGAYNFFIVIEDQSAAIPNVVWFMIVYFVFTVVEIAFLYRKISRA